MQTAKKGFTLVELLIVIGILGVLATAVVLVLNPAELLRQARDSTRLQDLATIHSALSIYVSSVSSPTLGETAYNTSSGSATCDSTASVASRQVYTVAGSGWVAVDFTTIPGGSPLSALPRDPVNDTTYFYCYDANNTAKTWELVTQLESSKFANGGADDRESTDGGDNSDWYEVGTDPDLDLL